MAVGIRTVATGTNDGSSATVSATTNTTPVSGDLVIAISHSNYYALSNMGAPSGGPSTWTEITDAQADGGTNLAHIRVYRGVLGASGAFTTSCTYTGSTDNEKGLALIVLSGADTTTPVDVAAGASGVSSTSNVAPSVSPTTTDAFLICATNSGGGSSTTSYDPPTGMIERYDTGVGGISLSGATLQLSASGATGTKTFTPANSIPWAATSVAIRTASGDTPISGSDTGTESETSSVAITSTQTDSATLSESASNAATLTASDTQALSEAASVAVTITASDTGTFTESGTIGNPVEGTDTGTLTEGAVTLDTTSTGTDTPSLTESASITVQITASDGITAAEAAALSGTLTVSDVLTLADVGSVEDLGATVKASSSPTITAPNTSTHTVGSGYTSTPTVSSPATSTSTVT